MSSVINFLDSVGRNGGWAGHAGPGYEEAVRLLDVAPQVREALMQRDPGRLGDALGGRPNMFCLILEPDEQPARRDDEQQEGGDEDSPKEAPEIRG